MIDLFHRGGLTYLFLGQQHGEVNNTGGNMLSAGQLVTSSYFWVVYQRDRVWVFQVWP